MKFHVITLFPEVCEAYTSASVLGRAQKTDKGKGAKVRGKKIEVKYYNPRDFTKNKHKKVDDRPYGGGPGMVMYAEPILRAWDKAVGKKKDQKKIKTLIMSPRGKKFDTIDSRVKKVLKAQEVSVGDYVLTGGELPALSIIDSVSRQIPGVLGTFESLEEERVSSGEMYTRPDELIYKGKIHKVPQILLEGDHKKIEDWKRGK